MIPMHQAMSRKRITIRRMVSVKEDETVWFISLTPLLSLTLR